MPHPVKRGWFLNSRDVVCVLVTLLCLLFHVAECAARAGDIPQFVLSWGGKGTNDGQFSSPIGIAIGPRDEIFVAEFNADRVQRFTTEGQFLSKFPVLKHPGGIAVDRQGRCYVSSMTEHKLVVYDAAGKALAEWGGKGAEPWQMSQPGGIVVDRDGTILVADQGNHRVQRFAPDGKLMASWGGYGKAPGQFGGTGKQGSRFGGPQFLAVGQRGNIYTTESSSGRIQRLDAHGNPLAVWGDNHNGPGGFGGRGAKERTPFPGPIATLVDRKGRVWVSATNNRIQLFTEDGIYLLTLGGDGDGPGQFHLPHGMAMDSKGSIYVCDASNQRIQKFAP